jgi:hypothetical protein
MTQDVWLRFRDHLAVAASLDAPYIVADGGEAHAEFAEAQEQASADPEALMP